MSTASDQLRDRAGQLRDALPPRRSATPPQENGRRIATIERSDSEQIWVNLCEYEGKPYVSVRLWKRNDQGQWWPDGKRGMSWRIRELPDIACALAELLDLVEAELGGKHQANRPAPPMPGRRTMDPANLPPAGGSGSGEFNECLCQRGEQEGG